MRQSYRVFLTDGFWRKTLAAVRSLGRAGHWVAVGETTVLAPSLYSRYKDRRVVYPDPIREEDRFIDELARTIRRFRIQVLMPMEEETLLTILRRRDDLPAGCRVPFSPPELIEMVRDKGRFARILSGLGIPTPRTWEPRSADDLHRMAREIGFPLVVKPRIGTGARGLSYVERAADLLPAWERASRSGLPGILQERLPSGGEAVGVSALCDEKGEAIAVFSHRRVREYPPTGGASCCRESVRAPMLEDRTRRLLRSIGWRGVAMAEFKRDDRSGQHLLLELNPRFWGSLSLPIKAGVDFPVLLCRMAMGEDVQPVTSYRLGVQGRTLLPGDLLHILRARKRDWRRFFSLAGRSVHFDFCSMDDPVPGAARVASLIPALGGRLWR